MRVLTSTGKEPFLIVAPHGVPSNDLNTDIVAEKMAKELNGFSVINVGWERIDKANVEENRANLNNLEHCYLEPCKKEFLQPIIDFKDKICNKYGVCFMILIHGMQHDDVDIVAGFGQGKPPSYSCCLQFKNRFLFILQTKKYKICQGKVGGKFSAWNKNNVNQLFVSKEPDRRVNSIQLELSPLLRNHPNSATTTGKTLASAVNQASWCVDIVPSNFDIDEY